MPWADECCPHYWTLDQAKEAIRERIMKQWSERLPAAIFYTGEWGDGPSLGSDWANEETLHEIIESLKPLDETWATLSISDAPLFNLVEEYPADGTGLYREEGVRHPPFYDTLIEADPHYPGYFRAIRSKD